MRERQTREEREKNQSHYKHSTRFRRERKLDAGAALNAGLGLLKPALRLLAPVLLVLVTLASYAPALRNGFVWDDEALVLRDPFIREARLIPEGFRHFLFADATASNFYRPIQRLSYTADYAMFEFEPWGWHLMSILVHAAAAVMLLWFLREFLARWNCSNRIAPFVAAMLWAIHPVHTSAVTYVAGRADSLAALFGFAALALSMKRAWLPTALCLLAAALSKESGLIFSALVILIHALRWERATLTVWLPVVLAVLAGYCGLRFSAESVPPPEIAAPAPLVARPILALRAIGEYAGLLIAPTNLHMEREILVFDGAADASPAMWRREFQGLAGFGIVCALGAWAVSSWRRSRAQTVLLLAAAAAYLPISNLLPLNAHVAEHWLYVPSALLFAAAGLALAPAAKRFPRTAQVAIAALAAFWATLTFCQQSYWRDTRTFVTETLQRGGRSARMLTQLGVLESGEGNTEAATAAFLEALKLNPGLPFARLGLARELMHQGHYPEARGAIDELPEFFEPQKLTLLAVIEYREHGRDRVDLLERAAALAPHDWALQRRYIRHLMDRGDAEKAWEVLRAVIEREPWRAEAREMLKN